ncbi:peptidyl-prolyl cis-trans isomerase B (cyclophilin B) [Desulfuromusa kysingii]|uniref:Peptidyl-prolyl cis-trans isomerase n=1 Tax=Desulfuromusa kysingii TaxID=37625 RepID=A0A1H4AJF9_9BACT|nr:peptidylprolyl isomerase [Desulfuromusa kysingii]SEA35921.1 peptidyl-prolyl cis-trans isomerase B (cyclophilin B) [Desulfuromusa kysingii]
MKQILLLFACFLLCGGIAVADPIVEMKTNMGSITIELNSSKAPLTVDNFLKYVDKKFYDDTIFHRVIGNFMIQGGGFDKSETKKATLSAIKNEADNGLKNQKGTISMARTGVVDSATSQFFINLVDNHSLNHRGTSSGAYGYAVFGKVIAGMDVVEKIGKVKTISKSALFRDYPEPQVIIESVRRVKK